MSARTAGWRAILGCAALLGGCFSGTPHHGYPETTAKLVFWMGATEFKTLYWLDNQHVFVPGYVPGENAEPKPGVHILDVGTNQSRHYADMASDYSFCYHDGFISYTVRTEEEGRVRYQKEGKLGEERVLPPEAELQISPSDRSSYIECPKVDRAKRLRPEHAEKEKQKLGANAKFLREEDGYIFAAQQKKLGERTTQLDNFEKPVKLLKPDATTEIELPILVKELGLGSFVRYSEWANKYVLVPSSRRDTPFQSAYRLAGNLPFQVYLVSPDGKVEAIPLQEGGWIPPGNVGLTKAGLFLAANAGSPSEDGGWLVAADGKRTRLYKGITLASGISPDGCKLVYAAAASKDNLTHIIDFCAKR